MTPNGGLAEQLLRPACRTWIRTRDRRRGMLAMVETLARGLSDPDRSGTLRGRLEAHLLQTIPLQTVEIHEAFPCGVSRAAERPEATGSVCLDIPGRPPSRAFRLEATYDASRGLDGWDRQMLEGAAALAALVLALESRQTQSEGLHARLRPRPDGAAPLIGSSLVMRALRERIERLASTDFTVLIEGESGTGKELVARQIHDLSRRARGPFVAINCAALVETLVEAELFGIEDRTATGVRGRRGKFEHAEGGTLFLDEVSDLSLSAQAKLLRAIQDLTVERVGGHTSRRVDIRILVATNRSLTELVNRGLFRRDLFYRLSGVELKVPALRTRREDIPELAHYFLARYRAIRPLELSASALEALCLHDWPGNVRELERMVEAAVALARHNRIDIDDLPPAVRGQYAEVLLPSLMQQETMRAWGSRYAKLVLARCGDNKRRACRALGISYHTLRAYLAYEALPGGQPRVPGRWSQAAGTGGKAFEPRQPGAGNPGSTTCGPE